MNQPGASGAGADAAPAPAGAGDRVQAMLRPRSIAVVGASATAGSFGDRLLRSITGWGYGGSVYPINPRHQELGGLTCFPDLSALPAAPDLVAYAINEARLPAAIEEAAGRGARSALVFSRGWVPDDAPRPTSGERWRDIAREAGMAVCGDNCMGFINFRDRLRASGNPVPVDTPCGGVALLSHSGSSWSGIVGNQRDIHLNYAVSVGREVVTGVPDYLQFLLQQPETRVIALLLETLRDRAGLEQAFDRASAAGIPVVALKLGRSERGSRFAKSHSGALAGSDAACRTLFDAHDVIAVRTLDEMLDTVEMFRGGRAPTTAAAGIGTDSGGERQLICDVAADVGLELAGFEQQTQTRLAGIMDPGMDPLNPVDYWGDGRLYFRECLEAVADDPAVGAVVMATNMASGRSLLDVTADAIRAVTRYTDKPVAKLGHLHSTIDRPQAAALRGDGIPVLMGTGTGLAAVAHFLEWHRRRAVPRPSVQLPEPRFAELVRQQVAGEAGSLATTAVFDLLESAGIPVAPWALAGDEAALLEAAGRIGYPVVLKTARPDVLHKSEQGGVVTGLESPSALTEAYARMADRLGGQVLLQRQAEPGVEMLLGIVRDPNLGAAVTVGTGGIYTEILRDHVTLLPPLDPLRVREAIGRLRGAALLAGARGRPPCDIDALVSAVMGFARLAMALEDRLLEADLNPLIVRADGVEAVDALLILDYPPSSGPPPGD